MQIKTVNMEEVKILAFLFGLTFVKIVIVCTFLASLYIPLTKQQTDS